MVQLDYTFDPEDLQRAGELDLAVATGTQLDYYLFCGNVGFRVDSVSFDAPWKWIPIFDFAIKINEIMSSLVDGQESVLEFTESEATISLLRAKHDVRITASYCSSIASAPFEELRLAALDFLKRVKRDLLCRFPALSNNVAFKERLALIGVGL